MNTEEFVQEFHRLVSLIDHGEFQPAHEGALKLLDDVSSDLKDSESYHTLLFNVAGLFIDIGGGEPNAEATSMGLKLLKDHEQDILKGVKKGDYFYYLSNGESNLLKDLDPFQQSFQSVEAFVRLKNLFWKAIKHSEEESGSSPPQYKVNLANALRSQFRVVEALSYYDDVNSSGPDIFESWVNRSAALKLLNGVSGSYTIRLLEEVRNGYDRAMNSGNMNPVWKESYRRLVELHGKKVEDAKIELGIEADQEDHAKTLAEYNAISAYRKFCIGMRLTLSEHALYCTCAGSARDNLQIVTRSGMVGDFVVPMERVLNRLKSEFSFARHLYYEFLTQTTPDEIQHELCFSELFDGEVLGLDIEKIRAGFRSCFGILDKIGAAICDLYKLNPKNEHVYFENMWRLSSDDRREKFEAVNNPGLLALYSIATDLNQHKGGEWSFYKGWRDDMEHNFVVVYSGDAPPEDMKPYNFMKNVAFIGEDEFLLHFERLLQLTRSAIFSFVFSVREHAAGNKQPGVVYRDNKIERRDFLSD
jgi:hypothetical protein